MGGRSSGSGIHQWFRFNKHNWPAGNKPGDRDDSGDYKLFDDESKALTATRGYAGFEYNGDGQAQEDWFKQYSNYADLIDGMSREERGAFLAWARGEFMDGQQYGGYDSMSSYEREMTKIYDKILDKAVLTRGVTVSRDSTAELIFGKGKKTATLEELKAAKGNIITSAGSMSTGAAKTGLSIGDSSKQILYRIQIPGGAKGAGMWIADSRIHGWGRAQLEFMTNRDSVFKVGDTVWDDRYKKYVVTLKWLGHKKHEYGKRGKARNWA